MKRLKFVNPWDVEITYRMFCLVSILLAILIFCLGISRCVQAGETLKEIEKMDMNALWEQENVPVSCDNWYEYEIFVDETIGELENEAQTQMAIGITICLSAIFVGFMSLKWLQVLFCFFYDQKQRNL